MRGQVNVYIIGDISQKFKKYFTDCFSLISNKTIGNCGLNSKIAFHYYKK